MNGKMGDTRLTEGANISSRAEEYIKRADFGVAFVASNKTGWMVSWLMAQALSSQAGWRTAEDGIRGKYGNTKKFGNTTARHYEYGTSRYSLMGSNIDLPPHEVAFVEQPGISMSFLKPVQVIYWYRDPVSLIMSFYKHHRKGEEFRWTHQETTCHTCDAISHAAVFSVCGFNCSFHQLVTESSEELGVVLSAMMLREQISAMRYHLQVWKNKAHVLHLTVEHLSQDFDATMLCLAKFLRFRVSTKDMLMKYPQINPGSGILDPHRSQYVPKDISSRRMLERHPQWGLEFREIRELANTIDQRQLKLYGCPVPSTEPHDV
jgi:hypothetical protein